ncbi:MAG: response regulator transcription factor [Anaerolineaceae bacterium]|nr:response regulator transcription factor [Anaerolineaceae bacterium]
MSELAPTLSVAIVANDPLARAGLATLLAAEPTCDIIAQMSLADWLADLQADDWDDALLDGIVWDVGWEATIPLAEEPFPLPVVALLPDETAVPHLWSLGIQALLRRDASAAAIVAALQTAMHGVAALDVGFVTAVLPPTPTPPELLPDLIEFTPREREVLALLAEGLTNKTIAHQLAISDHTVKFHVNAILGKLNAQSRTEAVVQATRLGLLLL